MIFHGYLTGLDRSFLEEEAHELCNQGSGDVHVHFTQEGDTIEAARDAAQERWGKAITIHVGKQRCCPTVKWEKVP